MAWDVLYEGVEEIKVKCEILKSSLTGNFYIKNSGLFFAGFDQYGNSGWTDENGAKPFATEIEAQTQAGLMESFADYSCLRDYEHHLRMLISAAEVRGWWSLQADATHCLNSLINLRKVTRTT